MDIIIVFAIVIVLVLVELLLKARFNEKLRNITIKKGLFRYRLVRNYGLAFGFLSNKKKIINIAIGIILVALLGIIVGMFIGSGISITLISLIILFSGGFSNYVDRLINGYVLDYISLNVSFKFPFFNLADIYILIGGILTIIFYS